jgi:tagaturonate reductase
MLKQPLASKYRKHRPAIKVVQFGEGNFLRAFVDYAFYELGMATNTPFGVAVVQPLPKGMLPVLAEQDGLYTVFLQGLCQGKKIDSAQCVDTIVKFNDPYSDFKGYLELAHNPELEFIVSNTTEAGIAIDPTDTFAAEPPNGFPAKLLRFLFERYTYFKGDSEKGLRIIPCELIQNNGEQLRECLLKLTVAWQLPEAFKNWLLASNRFYNTLVDRIVPGYPKSNTQTYADRLAYADKLMVTAESFFLWVIETNDDLATRLPFAETDLDVRFVTDQQPYRTRKVRILNGAHTAMVPFGLMHGIETVREAMDDALLGAFVREAVLEEIVPYLGMDHGEGVRFAQAIFERFQNPYIEHRLETIALNSISKYKVRVLPSTLAYIDATGELPKRLVFAWACLLRMYKGQWQGKDMPVNDNAEVICKIQDLWELENIDRFTRQMLAHSDFWGQDFSDNDLIRRGISKALKCLECADTAEAYKRFTDSRP